MLSFPNPAATLAALTFVHFSDSARTGSGFLAIGTIEKQRHLPHGKPFISIITAYENVGMGQLSLVHRRNEELRHQRLALC